MGYKLLPHTADVRIHVTGNSLGELFNHSLAGLCEVLNPGYKVKENEIEIYEKIEMDAVDSTALLIDFLSEALFYMYINAALLPVLKIQNLNNNYIIAEISGKKVDAFKEDVKAVTYHEAEIIENDKGQMETTIVPDI